MSYVLRSGNKTKWADTIQGLVPTVQRLTRGAVLYPVVGSITSRVTAGKYELTSSGYGKLTTQNGLVLEVMQHKHGLGEFELTVEDLERLNSGAKYE